MTLCLAAQCTHNKRDMVVFGADFSMESSVATAEIEYRKSMSICDECFSVLVAGSGSRARQLITQIHNLWTEKSDEEIFLSVCREGVQHHKYALADEYISARLGISYADFLGPRRTSIPKDQYRELMVDIERMKLGCALVITYFDDSESLLIRIEDDGSLEVCSNFAAIGTGMYIAEASLFQREHAMNDSLADTIYHVYEAMRLGSHAPGVGKKFYMGVTCWNVENNVTEWFYVEDKYQKLLSKEFDKFGPQKLTRQQLQKSLLRPLPTPKKESENSESEKPKPSDSQKSEDQK